MCFAQMLRQILDLSEIIIQWPTYLQYSCDKFFVSLNQTHMTRLVLKLDANNIFFELRMFSLFNVNETHKTLFFSSIVMLAARCDGGHREVSRS